MSAFTVTSDDITTATTSQPTPPRRRRRSQSGDVGQKYDLAGTGTNNRQHWSQADSLSANSANSPEVLARLRSRSRYESANNGYVGGLIRGRANDCIGIGPKMQIAWPESFIDPDFQRQTSADPKLAKLVEERWEEYCDSIGLVDKLHLIDKSETREGETFAVNDTNPNALPGMPRLDLRLYEADQCGDPTTGVTFDNVVAGIRLDNAGRPIEYFFYFQHPGDRMFGFNTGGEGEWVPARDVYHFFDPDRIGQAHGVPGLTAGLPLGAVMRRYTMASLGTAELQASIPCTLESDLELPDGDDESGDGGESVKDMQQIPFAHTVMLVTPAGRKAKPFTVTQPAPGYKDFKGEVNTEMGRGINAPRNVSTGSSAEYNYSSGRLDHLPWQGSHRIRRDRYRRNFYARFFRSWYAEAIGIRGYLPEGLPPLSVWRWRLRWPGFPSIDPVKDATANEIKLRSGQTTLDDVCAEEGKDWEEVLEQQARERKKRTELGLPQPNETPAAQPATNPTSAPATDPNQEPVDG